MPQAKGTATWLTNVRQDTPQDRVRLDNSRARIENKRIDYEHDQHVENIWLKYHRNKADMQFELKRARDEAEHWRRMRSQLEKDRVHSAIDSRRRERQIQRRQAEEAKYAIIGPDGETLHSSSKDRGTHGVKAGTSGKPFASRTPPSTGFDGGQSRFNTGLSKGKGDGRIRSGHRSTSTSYRSRNSHVSFSDDDDDDTKYGNTDDEDDDVFNPRHVPQAGKSDKAGMRQPRATSSSSVGRLSRRKSYSRGSVSSEVDPFDHASGQPGRSFQELRDLTHIDKITRQEKRSKKEELLKLRETRQAQEHEQLQRRISSFYLDMDNLKRKLTPVPREKAKPLRAFSPS